YGQTVTVPASAQILKGFTFEMNLPASVVFRGEVYAWNGSMASGASLFESTSQSTSGSGFQAITFTLPGGGVPLTSGGQYVLFASISKDPASGVGTWGYSQLSNPYSGGDF